MRWRLLGRPVLDWLRSCGACGRSTGPVDFFCAECWFDFRARAGRGAGLRQPVEDIPVFALWPWTRENDLYLRPLVYALKGGWNPDLAAKLAEDLSFARASLPLRPRRFRVVVPPRRVPGERDHARVLADAFARFWGASVWDGLGRSHPSDSIGFAHQKRKSAQERRKISFAARSPLAREDQGAAWVLIDDVVTTGATARAVHEALGRPNQFEVWALAARPPPADIAGWGGI